MNAKHKVAGANPKIRGSMNFNCSGKADVKMVRYIVEQDVGEMFSKNPLPASERVPNL